MNKKNVYMVQVDHLYGNEEKSLYLPYAVGLIAAYALADDYINSNYTLKGFVFWRQNIDEAVAALDSPFIIGFSCYVWNTEYNKAFAKRLKEVYPGCTVVFGGHNVPENTAMLEQFDYIDILVHGEGEAPFKSLLAALTGNGDFSGISNISYRSSRGEIIKTPNASPQDLDLPSPYLEGYFDAIVGKGGFSFCAVLETTRGCLHHCAYCDWGRLGSKIRQFPLDKIRKEIEWMAEHKIEYFWFADSSFGILERDKMIVDWLIELKLKTGYPKVFKVNYAENRERDVYEICRKLNEVNMNKGATLSLQSLNPTVLKNINRKSISMELFAEMMALYNEANIAMYAELILGLPGETYESFCRGIATLLEAGQHNALNLHALVLLPNSHMANPEYVKKFGIKTVRTEFSQFHCKKDENDIPEYYDLVVATDTMDTSNWVRATMFFIYIQTFHQLGLLQFFAIYLFHEKNIQYDTFYSKLLEWSEKNKCTLCGNVYTEFSNKLSGVPEGNGSRSYTNELFGNIVWPLEEGAFLDILPQFEQFYSEIESFLSTFNIETDIYKNLLNYQMGMMKLPGECKTDISLDYDFHNYFKRIYVHSYGELEALKNIVRAKDKKCAITWKEYATENVWYGRNDSRNIFSDISIEYLS